MNTELIRKLRVETNAGMTDCVKALQESDFDYDKAVDWLKAKSLVIAANKQDRQQKEGSVFAFSNHGKYFLGKCLCETDFAARTELFKEFVFKIGNLCVAADLDQAFAKNQFKQAVTDLEQQYTSSLREKVSFAGVKFINENINTQVFDYVHSNNKIGALVQLTIDKSVAGSKLINQLGNNLAMQVVAATPLAISDSLLSSELIDRQKNIVLEQMKSIRIKTGMESKILDGKMQKWYQEVCLLEQECIWQPKVKIKEEIAQIEKQLNTQINIVTFIREEI